MSLKLKHFIDIQAFKTAFSEMFHVGDLIYIEEKLDGSNASIQYDMENDKLQGFSRRHILTGENKGLTLDGFTDFIETLDKEKFKKYAKYRIFGEWNLRHIIKYPQDKIRNFYVFDVYDTENCIWLNQERAQEIAKDCDLTYVPIFYKGPFQSWEHINSFIGKTEFGLKEGEGVVVKNMTTLENNYILSKNKESLEKQKDKADFKNILEEANLNYSSRMPFVVKLVTAQFKERMDKPAKEPLSLEELAKRQYFVELVSSVVTPARIEKNLYKMIEDDIVPRDWGNADMKVIAKNLPSAVYYDCVKEANDVVIQVENFGKYFNKIVMEFVKELLKQKNI